MKRDTLTLKKFTRLSRKASIKPVEAAGLLEMLWHFTARNAPEGFLDNEDMEDLRVDCGYEKNEWKLVMEALVSLAWLDEVDGGFLVHDWSQHCEDSVKLKLARAGKCFADGTLPSTTKLSKLDRAALPAMQFKPSENTEFQACAQDAHTVRTPSAQDASAVRTAVPCHAMPIQAVPCAVRTDGNGVHTHTGTGRNRTTEHISALLPDIGIPASPEPPPRTKLSAARILAATREPPEAERYWAEMASALKTIGRLDVLRDGLERLETTSDLDSPAKWLNRQCTRELDKGGVKRPKSWKVKT